MSRVDEFFASKTDEDAELHQIEAAEALLEVADDPRIRSTVYRFVLSYDEFIQRRGDLESALAEIGVEEEK